MIKRFFGIILAILWFFLIIPINILFWIVIGIDKANKITIKINNFTLSLLAGEKIDVENTLKN